MSICEYCGKKIKDGNRFCHGHNNSKNNPGFKKDNIPWNKGSDGEYMKGDKNHFKGKHHTDAAKQKNREAHLNKESGNKGKKHPHLCGDKNPAKRLDIKEKIRQSKLGIPRSNSCKLKLSLHRPHYDSPLQGDVCFKSLYELAYAKYLDSKKILWYYEIETFDLGDNTYTPDFFLPQFEKFVEIKGYMGEESQEKINKFLEQYPWDLEILYNDDLVKLGCEIND